MLFVPDIVCLFFWFVLVVVRSLSPVNLLGNLAVYCSWWVVFILFNSVDGGSYHIETGLLILQSKSMGWFLYDRDLLHERVNKGYLRYKTIFYYKVAFDV